MRLLLCILLISVVIHSCVAKFFALLQDSNGNASLRIYDDTGIALAGSSEHFSFPFPLAEATSDPLSRQVYVIAYPSGVKGAALYILDEKLSLVSLDVSESLSYFDLQFSALQNAFYGIAVNGMYGRILSQLSLGPTVTYRPIQALPYMWYVNASTYDARSNRYFGLLNNFPRQPNSTLAQKLAVGDFATRPGSAVFLDLVMVPKASVIHFVSWSPQTEQLFGLAQNDDTSIAFVHINVKTGQYSEVAIVDALTTGPMFAAEDELALYALVKDAKTGERLLGRLDLVTAQFQLIHRFSDDLTVAAVSRLDW
eukprot:ANDGO_08180.mRNA.1 hypothetical protein